MLNNIHYVVIGANHFGILIPGSVSKQHNMSQEEITVAKRKWRKMFRNEMKRCAAEKSYFLKLSKKTQEKIIYFRLLRVVQKMGWSILNGY